MDWVKRAYRLVALLALLHLLAVGGGVVYLVATGRLTAEKVRAVVALFGPAEPPDSTTAPPDAGANAAAPSEDRIPMPGSVEEQIRRRALEREYMQADHRLVLANRQMTEVRRRQEELEQRQREFASKREQQVEEENKAGFLRDLEIVSMLKPKVALESLLARPVDEAARMLLEMEPRTSKKILEAANKDPRQWTRMLGVQQRLRDLAAASEGDSRAVASGGAEASAPAATRQGG